MCTSPIQLEKKCADGSFRTYVVPCGKCPECRAKYQSEYAALSVLEANSSGSLAFITLTYNSETLPFQNSFVRWNIITDDNGVESYYPSVIFDGISRGFHSRHEVDSECEPVYFGKRSFYGEELDFYLCPSLWRSDVQLLLKRYRQDYFRRHGERLDLRFTCFGEYGERFHRPHYHMLVYGLSRDEVERLASKWTLGFHNVQYVERFNSDGSDAFVKVSRYVSKYVAKCDYLPEFVQLGYAQKPRKQSSVRLGRRDLAIEHLRNFI